MWMPAESEFDYDLAEASGETVDQIRARHGWQRERMVSALRAAGYAVADDMDMMECAGLCCVLGIQPETLR